MCLHGMKLKNGHQHIETAMPILYTPDFRCSPFSAMAPVSLCLPLCVCIHVCMCVFEFVVCCIPCILRSACTYRTFFTLILLTNRPFSQYENYSNKPESVESCIAFRLAKLGIHTLGIGIRYSMHVSLSVSQQQISVQQHNTNGVLCASYPGLHTVRYICVYRFICIWGATM